MFYPDHIALNVKSLQRSRKFYTMLGGKVTSGPCDNFMEIKLGSVMLHLLPRDDLDCNSSKGIHHAAFKVDNLQVLESLCSALNNCDEIAHFGKLSIKDSPPMQNGKHVESNPPFKTLYFRDPDGILFEVRCYE